MFGSYFFSILAFLVWGLWGVFSKLATEHIKPTSAAVYEFVGFGAAVLLMVIYARFQVESEPRGMTFGFLSGFCAALGGLFYLIALTKGDSRTVTVTTSLYPLVTLVVLFALYREPVSLLQGIGMVMALIAMVLFAF